MNIKMLTIDAVTSAGGVYSSASFPVFGFLLRISYKPAAANELDTGADVTITESGSGLTLYSQANIGTTAFTKLPRRPISSSIDGADSTTVFDYIPTADKLTLTVANGGNVKSGTFYIVFGES